MQNKQINTKQTNKRKTYTQMLQNTHFFLGRLFLIEPLGVTNELTCKYECQYALGGD